MELRRSAGKAYQAGVLGADLSARSLYARPMAVFRPSLWRESDGRGRSMPTALRGAHQHKSRPVKRATRLGFFITFSAARRKASAFVIPLSLRPRRPQSVRRCRHPHCGSFQKLSSAVHKLCTVFIRRLFALVLVRAALPLLIFTLEPRFSRKQSKRLKIGCFNFTGRLTKPVQNLCQIVPTPCFARLII